MKKILYLIIGLLGISVSCSEEGPFETGKLDCQITTLFVTPNEAKLHILFPQNEENILESFDAQQYHTQCFLIKNPDIKAYDWQNEAIRGVGDRDWWSKEADIYFGGLSPNTTYYLVIEPYLDFNIGNEELGWSEIAVYMPGFSFSTN